MNLERGPDASLIASLARLWPNREHESSAVAGLLCRIGPLLQTAGHQPASAGKKRPLLFLVLKDRDRWRYSRSLI